MNDLKNRCQKRKLKEIVCKEKKRKAIESWKWQTYVVLLLAGMISLSAVIPARASAAQDADMQLSGEEQVSGSADGTMDADLGTAADTDAGTRGTDAQTPDNPAGTDAQIPDNPAGTDDAGQDGQETGADGNAASGTDSERPKVSADVVEDPKVNAEIGEEPPKVSADVTIEDEQDDNVVIAEDDKPYLALGANLNEEQKHTVLSLMGIDPASLDQYQVVTVTNEEEHQYLDEYLDASIIGTRALSSVVIVKRDKGDGIHISTKNISYCTIGMYKNALATAGLEDADVIIAGPFPLSGTAALIGAMKAYADMEDTQIDTQSLDAAMNEIVVTGELNESLGEDVKTEEFIAYVKQRVVEGGLKSRDKIEEVIAKACDQFEISLNENEKEQITALMQKIGSLDIDVDSLLEQAGSIYDSIREMEESGGFLSKIAAFFKQLLESVVQFFQNLF